jgi:hypothetical protein
MTQRRRKIAEATDATFDELTGTGTVVVAFYSQACMGYKDIETRRHEAWATLGSTWIEPRRRRTRGHIRRALECAAREHSRTLRVVFVEYEQCQATCHRLGVFAFATFWILKDAVRIGEMAGMYESGHRDSYRLARDQFAKWLRQHLPA